MTVHSQRMRSLPIESIEVATSPLKGAAQDTCRQGDATGKDMLTKCASACRKSREGEKARHEVPGTRG